MMAHAPQSMFALTVSPSKKSVMDASLQEDQKQTEELKAHSIFQTAYEEFEGNEGGRGSPCPEENVPPRRTELQTSEKSMPPNPKIREGESLAKHPLGPSAAEVAMAAEDLKRCMEEFGVDLATVTQAFLKNSGEVVAAECCLRTGQRSDGYPLWNRQDDLDLQAGDDFLRAKLEAKYGAENVHKRLAFRNS